MCINFFRYKTLGILSLFRSEYGLKHSGRRWWWGEIGGKIKDAVVFVWYTMPYWDYGQKMLGRCTVTDGIYSARSCWRKTGRERSHVLLTSQNHSTFCFSQITEQMSVGFKIKYFFVSHITLESKLFYSYFCPYAV